MRIEKQGGHFIEQDWRFLKSDFFVHHSISLVLSLSLAHTYFQVIFLESLHLHLPPRANERATERAEPLSPSPLCACLCAPERSRSDSSAPACLPAVPARPPGIIAVASRSLSRPIRPSCSAHSLVDVVVPFLHIARSRARAGSAYPLPKCFASLPACLS